MKVNPIHAYTAMTNQLPRFTIERAKMYEKQSVQMIDSIESIHFMKSELSTLGLYNINGKLT